MNESGSGAATNAATAKKPIFQNQHYNALLNF
jgi:hypothetical protein